MQTSHTMNGDAEAQFAELAGDGSMVLYEEDGCQQDKCGKGCLGQYLMNPFCHLRTVALREYAGYNGKKHQNQVLHDKAAYGEMDIYVQIAVYKGVDDWILQKEEKEHRKTA